MAPRRKRRVRPPTSAESTDQARHLPAAAESTSIQEMEEQAQKEFGETNQALEQIHEKLKDLHRGLACQRQKKQETLRAMDGARESIRLDEMQTQEELEQTKQAHTKSQRSLETERQEREQAQRELAAAAIRAVEHSDELGRTKQTLAKVQEDLEHERREKEQAQKDHAIALLEGEKKDTWVKFFQETNETLEAGESVLKEYVETLERRNADLRGKKSVQENGAPRENATLQEDQNDGHQNDAMETQQTSGTQSAEMAERIQQTPRRSTRILARKQTTKPQQHLEQTKPRVAKRKMSRGEEGNNYKPSSEEDEVEDQSKDQNEDEVVSKASASKRQTRASTSTANPSSTRGGGNTTTKSSSSLPDLFAPKLGTNQYSTPSRTIPLSDGRIFTFRHLDSRFRDVYNEWYLGADGNPPVAELEQQGCKWRFFDEKLPTRNARKWVYRRKIFVNYVDKVALEKNKPAEDVCDMIQEIWIRGFGDLIRQISKDPDRITERLPTE